MIHRNITITLSPKQAVALLYAAQVGDARIRLGNLPCGHKARNGAIRILERTIECEKELLRKRNASATDNHDGAGDG